MKVWIVQETIGGVPADPFVFASAALAEECVSCLYREGYTQDRYGNEVSAAEAIALGFLMESEDCEARVYECDVVEE